MALHSYITETDITHNHLKQFIGTDEMALYVAEANEHFEEVAYDYGVTDVTTLRFPISLQARQLLRHYVSIQFGVNSIGTNGSVTTEDVYLVIKQEGQEDYIKAKALLTPQILQGVATTQDSRTIRYGKAVRTS